MIPEAADRYAEWKSWRPADFGMPSAASSAYFTRLFRRFARPARRRLGILEIGFGNGQFLGWCRQQGHAVTGIETNPALLVRAAQAGFECHASLGALGGRRFDLIVLFDVLEHLPENGLADFLRELSAHLVDQGRIMVRTPNGGSPFGLNHQHGDPTHAAILTPNKFRYLAGHAGLALHYCGSDPYPLYAGSWQRLPGRALRKLLRRLAEAFVRFAFAPQPGGVLCANLLAVLKPARPCATGDDQLNSRVRPSDPHSACEPR